MSEKELWIAREKPTTSYTNPPYQIVIWDKDICSGLYPRGRVFCIGYEVDCDPDDFEFKQQLKLDERTGCLQTMPMKLEFEITETDERVRKEFFKEEL